MTHPTATRHVPHPHRRALAAVLFTLLLGASALDARRASAEPITGFVPQGAGQGLVVWGGGRVEELTGALRERGCTLSAAWVQVGDRFVAHIAGAPAFVNAPFTEAFPGGSIPPSTAVTVVCSASAPTAPPAGTPPAGVVPPPPVAPSITAPSTQVTFVYEDSVQQADRDAVALLIDSSLRALRDLRLGESSTIEVRAYRTMDALANAYSRATGLSPEAARAAWVGVAGRGGTGGIWLYLGGSWWTRADRWERQHVVAHELFHVLQGEFSVQLGGSSEGEVRRSGPEWLLEGGADYAARRVAEVLGGPSMETARKLGRARASSIDIPLRVLETRAGMDRAGNAGYELAMLGVDALLRGRDASALRTFYSQVGTGVITGMPWPQAFEIAFGTSPGTFYQAWDGEWNAYLATTTVLTGRVLESGAGVPAIHVWACPATRGGTPCSRTTTGADGVYRIRFEDAPTSRVMFFGPTMNGCAPFGLLGSTGLVTEAARARVFTISGPLTTFPDLVLPRPPDLLPTINACSGG